MDDLAGLAGMADYNDCIYIAIDPRIRRRA